MACTASARTTRNVHRLTELVNAPKVIKELKVFVKNVNKISNFQASPVSSAKQFAPTAPTAKTAPNAVTARTTQNVTLKPVNAPANPAGKDSSAIGRATSTPTAIHVPEPAIASTTVAAIQ